jgi:excisionase family DNA binding protein
MADELLTVADIAATFRVHPQTVRNWIDRGELQAVRVGSRRVRVRREDLDRFITASQQDAAKPKASPADRLAALEQQVAELAARLDRLEGPP